MYLGSRQIKDRFPTRRFSRNSNPNGTLQRRDRGIRTVSNIQTMKLLQASETNPANSVKQEEKRPLQICQICSDQRAAKQMRPGYRTKSHSSGEDLEGNQGSPWLSKIFVHLRQQLAIKDVMQSKRHSFIFSISSQVFWHQSEARTATTVWNWSGKTLSPGALLAVLYFSSCHIFFRPFRLFLVPTICPWVSEDAVGVRTQQSVIQGGSAPRSNPFNTLWQKSGTSFVDLLLTNSTPFTHLVQNIASL